MGRVVAIVIVLMLGLGPLGQAVTPTMEVIDESESFTVNDPPSANVEKDPEDMLSNLDGFFTENLGQKGDGAGRYYCQGTPLSIAFGIGWIAYDFKPPESDKGIVFSVHFKGSNEVAPVGRGQLGHRSNFINGNDPSKWVSGVRTFRSIEYPSLYDGIDLRFYHVDGQMKYEFDIEPLADPGDIVFEYDHVDRLSLDDQENLIIHTSIGDLVDSRPITHYLDQEPLERIPSSFRISSQNILTFDVGSYDDDRRIRIDPGLEFLTYLGGIDKERFTSILLDDDENIYLTGGTSSSDFPTTMGSYDTNLSNNDAYLVKTNPDCSQILFSTLIGGSKSDEGRDIVLADNGSIIVLSITQSKDFPTTNGGGNHSGIFDNDAALSIISPSGDSLVYGRYVIQVGFGPAANSLRKGVNDNIYICGRTNTRSLPVTTGWDLTHNGDTDGFVIMLSSDCTKILSNTFIGGSNAEGEESAYDNYPHMDIDPDGTVYVSGRTHSPDFPTSVPTYQSARNGDTDAFLVKLNAQLTTCSYSTYFGGSGYESEVVPQALGNGRVMISGITTSSDLPTTTSSYQRDRAFGQDCFSAFIDTVNNKLEYTTYYGGSKNEWTAWMEARDGYLYGIIGTRSPNLETTPGCYDDLQGGDLHGGTHDIDLYFFWLDRSKAKLVYGSYLGGNDFEQLPKGCLLSDPSTLIFGAMSRSHDLPTKGGFQLNRSGNYDTIIGNITLRPFNLTSPSVPENLTADVHHGAVGLGWSKPSSLGARRISHYEIAKGTRLDNLTDSFIEESEYFYDTDVAPGITYYYKVRANNYYLNSNWTAIVNITYYSKPTADLNFSATYGSNKVFLSWDRPTDPNITGGFSIKGFRIYRGTFEFDIPLLLELGNETSYIDESVGNGQIYYYRLSAVTEAGEGPQTQWVKVKPIGLPGPPIHLYASGHDGYIILGWSQNPDTGGANLEGYHIYTGPSPDNLTHYKTVGPASRIFNDTDLVNGQAYYYAIIAINEVGDSVQSGVIKGIPYGLPGPPSDPRAIVGNGTVYLHWGRPAEDGGAKNFTYLVWIETFDGEELDVLPTNDKSFVWTNLTNGVTYRFKIQATTAGGFGPVSDIIYATPMTIPDPPREFVITPDERSIGLSWDFPEETGGYPVQGFIIYRGETEDYLEPYVTIDSEIPSFVDEDIEDGQTYYYMVAAVTTAGEGPATPIISATAIGPPTKPLDLKAEAGDSEVMLTWIAPDYNGGRSLWGYVVFRGDSVDDMTEIARLGLTLSFTDEGLDNGCTYHYSIAARNSIDDGAWSNIVEAIPLGSPDSVRNLQADIDETTVTLRWDAPLDDGGRPVLGYVVMRGLSYSDLEEIAQVGIIQSYTDEGLERGRLYYYKVAAWNGVGRSEFSDPVQATIDRVDEPVQEGNFWLLLIAIMGACLITVGAVASTESGRYRWGLLLGPLTTRLRREEVLDNKTRHALLGIIITNPGIHYQAIKREFELKNGVAAYHLDVLERENFVRSVRDGRLKRFYSTDTKVPRDRRSTPEELREEILDLVIANPGISQKEVVNELGVESDTVGYHLRTMVADGTINDERRGKYMTYYRENHYRR